MSNVTSPQNSVTAHRWKQYPKYKDSGVVWLGGVPDGWQLIKAKWLFKEIIDRNHVDEPLLSVTQQKSVVSREDSDIKVWNPTEDVSGYKLVKRGDFVISLRSFQGGIEYSTVQGIVSPAYVVIRKRDLNCNNYFRFLFKSEPFISALNVSTTGIRQGKNIGYEDFSFLTCPVLTQNDCESIATFLDRETARIDALIGKKERQIELLQEKRVALISHAVMKGLDPNVKMKDSGVEWIGKVPKHWNVKKLKFLAEIKGRIGFRGYTVNDLVPEGEGALTIGATHFNEKGDLDFSNPEFISWKKYHESPEIMVKTGDILIVQRGSTGKVTIINRDLGDATINPSLVLIKKLKIFNRFLFFSLSGNFIKDTANLITSSTAIPMISQEQISEFVIIEPKTEEQYSIVDYLDHQTSHIDTLIEKVRHAIDLLNEYRIALISAAVTGKIDVRGEVKA